jgi:hypothetical protein
VAARKAPSKARKAPSKARKPAAKKARKKVTPCEKCAGFDVPVRRVASVARAANGRFKRPAQGRLL